MQRTLARTGIPIAGLAVFGLIAVGVATMLVQRPAAATIASPGNSSSATATPRPGASHRANPAPPPSSPFGLPPTPLQGAYVSGTGGFWFDARGQWTSLNGAFGRGRCAFLCSAIVSVLVGDPRVGIDVPAAHERVDTIRGRTLKRIRRLWLADHPGAEFETANIDGATALRFRSGDGTVDLAVAVHEGRLYVVSGRSFFVRGDADVDAFLRDLHFLPTACWIEPCPGTGWTRPPDPVITLDRATRGDWTVRPATWGSGPGPTDRTTASFWLGRCADNLCPGYVTVSIGTGTAGPIVEVGRSNGQLVWERAAATALAQLAPATTEILGDTPAEQTEVDGVRALRLTYGQRVVVLVEHRGRLLAITAFPGPLGLSASATMKAFLRGVTLPR